MKRKRNYWKKADDGAAKTITIALAIGIAFMLSVGITIAQQTQGNAIVNNAEQKTVADDCPCHNVKKPTGEGGLKTEVGGNYVCPSILDGISYIQSQGETWYNEMITKAYINQLRQQGQMNFVLPGGKGGSHGISQQVSGHAIPVPLIKFPSWTELQQRFVAVQAYANGTGLEPSWWTPQMYQVFTSPGYCSDINFCLMAAGGIQIIITMFMGIMGSTNAYLGLIFIEAMGFDAFLFLACLTLYGLI